MSNDKYNGWTNYETWCVYNWLDSDENTQEYWRKATLRCLYRNTNLTNGIVNDGDTAYDLEKQLRFAIVDNSHGFYSTSALERVDFLELATFLVKTYRHLWVATLDKQGAYDELTTDTKS